ncbi:hypothetical protein ACSS7Z_12650 [Microbacterium sp. A82]|uniref:hypothetical protein n=1 Tax=Microbacterium sp. A82 TaxID=3450452 RepID=UPI003F406AC5
MRNRTSSILVVVVLALTMTGCSGTSNNTDACRDLLNIQGELDLLVGESTEASAQLDQLADDARSIDAEGDVKIAATSLGNAVADWSDALAVAAEGSTTDNPVSSADAVAYVDAGVDVRNACSQYLP